LTQKATAYGSYTYDLECAINSVVTDAAVIINVAAPAAAAVAAVAREAGAQSGSWNLRCRMQLIGRRRRARF
jgi:hypothetical protein